MTAPRPPLPWLLAYRFLGLRLPDEYRPWVAEDVKSGTFAGWRGSRTVLWGAAFIGLYCLAQATMLHAPAQRTLVRLALAVVAVSLLASRSTLVRRTLRWQRIDKRGRPVAPHKLAMLENVEALLLGVAVLVTFTGAAAVFGYAQRPTGLVVAKCETPSAELRGRIEAGLRTPGSTILTIGQLSYRKRSVVVAQVQRPGKDQPEPMLLVIDDGHITEARRTEKGKPDNGLTTFDGTPEAVVMDRDLGTAVYRIYQCLAKRR